jgi:hypothetical protein
MTYFQAMELRAIKKKRAVPTAAFSWEALSIREGAISALCSNLFNIFNPEFSLSSIRPSNFLG